MSSTVVGRRCAFVDRPCEVESDEVPLEVCRLCLEAWKAESELITVKRPRRAAETHKPAPVEERAVEEKPVARSLSLSKTMNEELRELDKLFTEGKIGVEEYVERRKGIVNSAASPKGWLKQLEERWLQRQVKAPLCVVLVEGGRTKTVHPEIRDLPDWFENIAKPLLELCRVLRRREGSVRLEAGELKVVSLGYRDGKLALLFLGAGQSFSDYEETFKDIRRRLEEDSDWEDALPKLYDDYFRQKQPPYIS